LKAVKIAEKMWLKLEIQELYKKKRRLNKTLYRTHLNINNEVHPAQSDVLMQNVNDWIQNKAMERKRIVDGKLTKLIKSQAEDNTDCKHEFFPRLINQSSITFDENEIKLLEKGLKHNISTSDKNFDNTLLDVESVIQTLPLHSQEEVRYEVARKIDRIKSTVTKQNTGEEKTARSIRTKAMNENALITKADKGNTVVVLDRNVYDDKVNEFLVKNKITLLQKDPTQTFSKAINKAIENSNNLFTQEQKRRLKVMKPTAPKLKGLPKVHKDGIPIRPLVNSINSPAYYAAKTVNRLIKDNINLHNNRSLQNTTDLIDKIKHINIPSGAKLVSFDVQNLYTSIPVNEAIILLDKELRKNVTLSDEQVNEIVNLTRTILQQNYFQFNNKFYSQKEGLAMGSPLSGTLADIFMNHIENTLFEDENPHSDKIIYWYRYVDDIIALVQSSKRQVELLHKHLNKLHPRIQFTSEVEINNALNFLDITITNRNNKHNFSIYRKPTQSDMVIHKSSNHPRQQKMAAFRSMFYRLEKVPMDRKDYEDELKTIQYIAQKNGYNKEEISKVHSMVKHRINKGKVQDTTETKNYVSIEYHEKVGNILLNTLKNHNCTLSFKTNNTVGSKLMQNEKSALPDPYSSSGVYRIKCSDCESFYIGQTGREFKTRFKEHIRAITRPDRDSKFAEHIINSNHTYVGMRENMSIIKHCRKGKRLSRWEEVNIYKHYRENRSSLLNEKVGLKHNPLYERTYFVSKKNENIL